MDPARAARGRQDGDDLRPGRSLGKRRVSDLSVARNEVIKKGLLYTPERGQLAFTVPGMHTIIARQD